MLNAPSIFGYGGKTSAIADSREPTYFKKMNGAATGYSGTMDTSHIITTSYVSGYGHTL